MSRILITKKHLYAILLSIAFLAGTSAVIADCTTYPNSRIEYYEGQAVCAGYGSGCTECTGGGGGGCVTNGSSCGPLHDTP